MKPWSATREIGTGTTGWVALCVVFLVAFSLETHAAGAWHAGVGPGTRAVFRPLARQGTVGGRRIRTLKAPTRMLLATPSVSRPLSAELSGRPVAAGASLTLADGGAAAVDDSRFRPLEREHLDDPTPPRAAMVPPAGLAPYPGSMLPYGLPYPYPPATGYGLFPYPPLPYPGAPYGTVVPPVPVPVVPPVPLPVAPYLQLPYAPQPLVTPVWPYY